MNRTILILTVISALTAQEGNNGIADPPAVTGASEDTTSNDSLGWVGDSLGVAVDTIGPPMDLDYGYKGFMWGAPLGSIPNLQYMGEPMFIRDSTALQMSGFLGQEAVIIEYVFSDSGFWKVEIQYSLDPSDYESHLELFTQVERSLSEVYGFPQTTDRIESGAMGVHDIVNIGFERAFYFSSWNVSPVKISLLLNSIVQVPKNDLNIFGDDMSIMKLVYYNPDYMIMAEEIIVQEPPPSIFDIY
ncbi:MAG: hypothetical protein NZ838_12680 [Candidatus Marinimicrobia bacterium]|nr:hypothetical protein [Candidatus Neomarinimicrobiota bacterium]